MLHLRRWKISQLSPSFPLDLSPTYVKKLPIIRTLEWAGVRIAWFFLRRVRSGINGVIFYALLLFGMIFRPQRFFDRR